MCIRDRVYGAYAIDATGEALHLAEVLTGLAPDDPEAHGLAALMQLAAARAAARVDGEGRFVPLAEQDPGRWDRALIGRAHEHLRRAHAAGRLGRFQLEAAIQAVHCVRPTDWWSLLGLHQVLDEVAPSLGGSVAFAVVVAEVEGPAAGLARLDVLGGDRFQPALAARAHLLERTGRNGAAVTAYRGAILLTSDRAERDYLEKRLARLDG